MIDKGSIQHYTGPSLMRGETFAYLRPDARLLPYIANYTITCPATMPDGYTVLPTASATLVYSMGANAAISGLRGVNTRASTVGTHANRFEVLLLIEFHPAGLYPLLHIPQNELLDASFAFDGINKQLDQQIYHALEAADTIDSLAHTLNQIFLARLAGSDFNPDVILAMRHLVDTHGAATVQAVSQAVYRSDTPNA